MNVQNNNIRKGFTLIELLVVVAIIGILASVVLASLNTARAKARDAKRLSDAKQIYTALESYYLDHGGVMMGYGFLTSCGGDFASGTGFSNAMAPYISSLPLDPLNTGLYCYTVCTEGSGCNTAFPDPDRYYVYVNKENGGGQYLKLSR